MKKIFYVLVIALFFIGVTGCDLLSSDDDAERAQTNGSAQNDNADDSSLPASGTTEYTFDDFEEVEWGEDGDFYYAIFEGNVPLNDAILLIKIAAAEDGLEQVSSLFDFSDYGYSLNDFPNGLAFEDEWSKFNVGFTSSGGVTQILIVGVEHDYDGDRYATYDLTYSIPVYNAASAVLNDEYQGDDYVMYVYTITGDFDTILEYYENWLESDGWDIWWETDMFDGYVYYADKGNLDLTIFVQPPWDLEAPENTWDLSITINIW